MQSFTSIDHAGRVDEIAAQLSTGGLGCEALLFADLTDVRWLTGFTGSNGWAVLRGGVLTVGTDGRYEDRARAETADSGAEVVALQRAPELHQALADLLQGGTVGLNPSSVDHATWSRLAATVDLRAIDSPVGVARQVKSDGEIERISAAAATADAALSDVEPMLRSAIDSPVTEADVRNELEYRMRLHGADDRSYNTIVAAGPDNAARPHHEVGYRTIVEGDTVVIDVGGLVDGYHSDMTRSYVIGEPTPQQRDIYDLVQQSQAAGLAALGDGVSARSVDSACRDVFVAAGFGDWYVHGTGHGVGLQIHESPFHSQVSTEMIRVGNVVTVEPGLYRGGFGGIRIEDLVVVTADGHRCLTHHPKCPFVS